MERFTSSRKTYLDADWDKFKWDTTRLFTGIEHQINDDWLFKINADYQYAKARCCMQEEILILKRVMEPC